MSYNEYFHTCLTDPEYGYYMNNNVFSERGDFVTGPEISQIFSEMIGLWHVMMWE